MTTITIAGMRLTSSLLSINPRLAGLIKAARKVSTPGAVTTTAHRDGDVVTIVAKGLRLVNGANEREHWSAASRRAKRQREVIGRALSGVAPPPSPWCVTIVRSGPRSLDTDGLTISAKHLRDAIAAWLGCDDSPDAPVTWRVTQRGGGYSATIDVRPAATSLPSATVAPVVVIPRPAPSPAPVAPSRRRAGGAS